MLYSRQRHLEVYLLFMSQSCTCTSYAINSQSLSPICPSSPYITKSWLIVNYLGDLSSLKSASSTSCTFLLSGPFFTLIHVFEYIPLIVKPQIILSFLIRQYVFKQTSSHFLSSQPSVVFKTSFKNSCCLIYQSFYILRSLQIIYMDSFTNLSFFCVFHLL